MTFDEAETKVENLVGDLNIPLGVEGALLDVIDKLREEYAPTVEMTKEQANHLKSLTTEVGNEFNEEELPADGSIKITDKMIELDDSYLPLKYLNAVLHPETIKVVDE